MGAVRLAALRPKSEMSFVNSPRADTPFLTLSTDPSATGHWRTCYEQCQLRECGDMSLEECRSPSCCAAEKSASFSAGRKAIFNYWSLGLPVTGALVRCRQTFELNSTAVIAASLRCYLCR